MGMSCFILSQSQLLEGFSQLLVSYVDPGGCLQLLRQLNSTLLYPPWEGR